MELKTHHPIEGQSSTSQCEHATAIPQFPVFKIAAALDHTQLVPMAHLLSVIDQLDPGDYISAQIEIDAETARWAMAHIHPQMQRPLDHINLHEIEEAMRASDYDDSGNMHFAIFRDPLTGQDNWILVNGNHRCHVIANTMPVGYFTRVNVRFRRCADMAAVRKYASTIDQEQRRGDVDAIRVFGLSNRMGVTAPHLVQARAGLELMRRGFNPNRPVPEMGMEKSSLLLLDWTPEITTFFASIKGGEPSVTNPIRQQHMIAPFLIILRYGGERGVQFLRAICVRVGESMKYGTPEDEVHTALMIGAGRGHNRLAITQTIVKCWNQFVSADPKVTNNRRWPLRITGLVPDVLGNPCPFDGHRRVVLMPDGTWGTTSLA